MSLISGPTLSVTPAKAATGTMLANNRTVKTNARIFLILNFIIPTFSFANVYL
jgi:hypothetical protein